MDQFRNPVYYLKQEVKCIVSIKQPFLCLIMCVNVNSGVVYKIHLILVSKMVVSV